MSLFCPDKKCKAKKGACSHERWMASAAVIAVGIFLIGKTMHWF